MKTRYPKIQTSSRVKTKISYLTKAAPMTDYDPWRLAGILAGAYTCEYCNSPSVAAEKDGTLTPVCSRHAQEAGKRAGVLIREQPKTMTKQDAGAEII